MKKSADFFRKRPKQTRALDLVDTILIAAGMVFQKHGVAKVTTNDIAARAGISIGSLYRYFPNKESIVAALIEKELSRHFIALDSVLDKTIGESDAATIQFAMETLCDLYFENLPFLQELFQEQGRGNQVQIMVLKHLNFEKLIGSIRLKRGAHRSERFEARIFVAVHAVMGVLHAVVERYPDIPDRAAVCNQTVILAKKYLLPLNELKDL